MIPTCAKVVNKLGKVLAQVGQLYVLCTAFSFLVGFLYATRTQVRLVLTQFVHSIFSDFHLSISSCTPFTQVLLMQINKESN
jgi:hypothetical protein